MNVVTPERPAQGGQAAATGVEGEIRGLRRREIETHRRPQPQPGGEAIANQVNSLIQRVSVTSVQEIDKLIFELQSLRNFLHNESERVQREVASYSNLSEATLRSTKIIAESMAQWKNAAERGRGERT